MTSFESRRVAELLSQLPADMDVEGMVERSWAVVMQQALTQETTAAMFIRCAALQRCVTYCV